MSQTKAQLVEGFNINTSVPADSLAIDSSGTVTLTSNAATAPFIVNIDSTEAARIDSSGRLLVGTTSVPADTLDSVSIVQSGPSITKSGYHASVGTTFVSIPGASVGNETSVYLVTIRARGDGNFYSTATFILNSAAYDKTFTQIGTTSDHFGNGTLSAQLSSYSGTSSSVQVKRSGSGIATVHVNMLRLM